MEWHNHSRDMKDDAHAFLSPSAHSWINYEPEKLMQTYINKLATARGTALHELACRLIKLKVRLPNNDKTLNMYVNDAIKLKMDPEVKLFYSKFCYGTTDAISIAKNFLRIHDLKSGKNPASFSQLRIYAALFFLEYPEYKVGTMSGIELRIYQNDEIRIENPEADDILPIMDKIVKFSTLLEGLEDEYDDGFDALGSWS